MQVGIRVRGAEQVAGLEQRAVPCQRGPQPFGAGVVDPLGGEADGKPLEHGTRLEDLDRLDVGDLAHTGASMRLAHDEPFLLEADQRVPYGGPGHVEARDHVRLDEAGVGGDLAPDDRGAQPVVVGLGGGGRVIAALPAWRSVCSPK